MAQRDDIECWLTDMDGVLVHENDAIPGASELLAGWESAGIRSSKQKIPSQTTHDGGVTWSVTNGAARIASCT